MRCSVMGEIRLSQIAPPAKLVSSWPLAPAPLCPALYAAAALQAPGSADPHAAENLRVHHSCAFASLQSASCFEDHQLISRYVNTELSPTQANVIGSLCLAGAAATAAIHGAELGTRPAKSCRSKPAISHNSSKSCLFASPIRLQHRGSGTTFKRAANASDDFL
jgi:hypothetical protein